MKNLCDSVLCEFRTSGKSTVCAFWDTHRELGWLKQGGHQLGLAGWQVPDNGGRGQRTLWAGGLEERGQRQHSRSLGKSHMLATRKAHQKAHCLGLPGLLWEV